MGWDDLLRAFATATVRRGLPFTLVTCGGGEVNPPAEVADRVIDVGFLPDDERDNAFAAADAYLQPSRYEAFSRTVMESWLAGTPVVANGGSAVVRYHCERSGAGLVYDDDLEFEECLAFLAAEPTAGAALAAGGRDYVLANYGWDDVLDRIEDAFEAFRTAAGAPA
jgi:glycosyltransferase involved in cell wall biosynthesis